jgi:hypothetical protein
VRLVGMFELRGVYDGVVGADEREQEGDAGRDAERGSYGRPNGAFLELPGSDVPSDEDEAHTYL